MRLMGRNRADWERDRDETQNQQLIYGHKGIDFFVPRIFRDTIAKAKPRNGSSEKETKESKMRMKINDTRKRVPEESLSDTKTKLVPLNYNPQIVELSKSQGFLSLGESKY